MLPTVRDCPGQGQLLCSSGSPAAVFKGRDWLREKWGRGGRGVGRDRNRAHHMKCPYKYVPTGIAQDI